MKVYARIIKFRFNFQEVSKFLFEYFEYQSIREKDLNFLNILIYCMFQIFVYGHAAF